MAKRKSRSIKPARAAGIGKPLSARCRPTKTGDGMGSAAIDSAYTAMERLWDHIGMPERATPLMAPPPRKPYVDPATLPVIVPPEVALARAKQELITRLCRISTSNLQARRKALAMAVAERERAATLLEPKPEPETLPAPVKAPARTQSQSAALEHARTLAKAADEAMKRALAMA